MLTRDDNDTLTRTGQGTLMGEVIRRYWVPALLANELPEPDLIINRYRAGIFVKRVYFGKTGNNGITGLDGLVVRRSMEGGSKVIDKFDGCASRGSCDPMRRREDSSVTGWRSLVGRVFPSDLFTS